MLKRIDRHILRVPNLEAAVRYYRDVLGLKVHRHEKTLATFALEGGAELVIRTDANQPAEVTYYLVDDVRELHARRDELRLKFIAGPSQVARGFSATVKDPFGTVLHILDRTAEASSKHEDATPTGQTLFAGVEPRVAVKKDLLIKLYENVGLTADDLPYTPHFEKLYEPYVAALGEPAPGRAEVWRHILNLRKAGKLPKLGEARSKPPNVTPQARDQLRSLLGKDLGKRDRLPYTERFDAIVDGFNRTADKPLSPHLVWRLVATLAK